METKTRKTTMIGAALAVAIIALAGAGYAAVTHYTAETSNSGNTMDATYLTLTQEGGAAYTADFLKDIYFNSVNTGTNTNGTIAQSTTYTPVYDYNAEYGTSGTLTLALISNAMSLKVAPTNSAAGSVSLKVTVDHFSPVTGLTYTMVLQNGNNTPVAVAYNNDQQNNPNSWYFSSLALNNDGASTDAKATDTTWTVKLFVSGSATTPSTGFPASTTTGENAGPTPDEDKATFTFVMDKLV